jgi:hypothetical protein
MGYLKAKKTVESVYGCFFGNNRRKVSCWEDGSSKKYLKRSTAGGIAFPES